MPLIYMDVCCLNRPFDNQVQGRIRMESEAILLILARCQSQEWQLLSSEVVEYEVSRIPDEEKREKVLMLSSLAKAKMTVDELIERRAIELEGLGFKAYDALHFACAENGGADILLTVDDQFLRQAKRHGAILKVRVENPVLWLMEVTKDEE